MMSRHWPRHGVSQPFAAQSKAGEVSGPGEASEALASGLCVLLRLEFSVLEARLKTCTAWCQLGSARWQEAWRCFRGGLQGFEVMALVEDRQRVLAGAHSL